MRAGAISKKARYRIQDARMPERVFETPANVRLGPLDQIADGKARNFVLEIKGARFFGFVVRQGESVRGFVDSCPHMQLPLTQKLDDYLTPDGQLIHCVWHGAAFRIDDGVCIVGPCTGQKLREWPVTVRNSEIITA